MKYLAKSAEVLNEADRYQRQLDWELFTMSQEARLWGYDGTVVNHLGANWVPGLPIYPHPSTAVSCDCEYCYEDMVESGNLYMGNHVRPMIEEYEDGDNYFTMSCNDCQVSWDRYVEDSCWNCGKEYPRLERAKSMGELMRPIFAREPLEFRPADLQQALNTPNGFSLGIIQSFTQDADGLVVSVRMNDWAANMMRQMQEAALAAERSFSRMYAVMSRRNGLTNLRGIMDEYLSFDLNMINEFRPTPYRYQPVQVTDIFKKREFQKPLWGEAALYNPYGEQVSYNYTQMVNRFLLPGWRNYQPQIPVPQLLEPRDFSDWSPGVRTGPPTTPDWRRRGLSRSDGALAR